jgi:hypothetical protein
MAVNKIHAEFFNVDLDLKDWTLPGGYPPDALAWEKNLSGDLDDKNKKGSRTRLLRFGPGFRTTEPFVHDYWEEVFLLEGDMTVGADAEGKGGKRFGGYTYAVRPPGVAHGPFSSEKGALLIEIHYYDPA